ncbi:hypothetical protein, partial [Streptomyces sp. NPDC002491]
AAAAHGLPGTPAALVRHARAWQPWRGYAVQYLWAAGEHAVDKAAGDEVTSPPTAFVSPASPVSTEGSS